MIASITIEEGNINQALTQPLTMKHWAVTRTNMISIVEGIMGPRFAAHVCNVKFRDFDHLLNRNQVDLLKLLGCHPQSKNLRLHAWILKHCHILLSTTLITFAPVTTPWFIVKICSRAHFMFPD